MEQSFDPIRQRAHSLFKKEELNRDKAQAMSDYQANAQAVRQNMARLRALRLAKEARENDTARTKKTIRSK